MPSVDDEKWTFLTPALAVAIKQAIAREGGPSAFEAATGIRMRSVRRVLCAGSVSLSWMDKFCSNALTDLWVTDFEWRSWKEILRAYEMLGLEGVRDANGFYESPVGGTEGVPGVGSEQRRTHRVPSGEISGGTGDLDTDEDPSVDAPYRGERYA